MNQRAFYPPREQKLGKLIAKALSVLVVILIFAWLEGVWLVHFLPRWVNLVMVSFSILVVLWTYRIGHEWCFRLSEKNKISVCLTENLFLHSWVLVSIDGEVVSRTHLWRPESINVGKRLTCAYSNALLQVRIRKIEDTKNLECSLVFDSVNLVTD